MRKIALISALILVANYGLAQYSSYVDGSPVNLIKKVDVEGSEMLYEHWSPATIRNVKGETYKNVMVKYNLLEDVPYFRGKSESVMAFNVPLLEFVIQSEGVSPRRFKAGFPAFGRYGSQTFYEVLVEGEATLLKKNAKKIVESRAYNAATTVKTIVDVINYYILLDGRLTEVKNNKKAISVILSHKTGLNEFLSNKKLELKKEKDLISVLEYYNLH